ncbi:ThiF family adenylyltransferase [Cohnella rhizosphaerae]|uniref:ThiF family adenylyltransferase n=1 Tax=Cohnella rhizosphaerae TaxID=1457232 RepID=A0A9X4QSM5_9BACL|nr:ThiF family adenylyltransferase [Cohnella rhizosphaerae]MDG0808722.1 ThiF family adenylyltransferase [Cohnella rhizosphaerae]
MSSAETLAKALGKGRASLDRAAVRHDEPPSKYDRQIRFAPIGAEGQRLLGRSAVLVAGVGALGCALAQQMVRAGIGTVRLADRDFVERGNLHRQSLFDEADAAASTPKAVAAAARLRAINGAVGIEPHVVEIGPANVGALLAGVDLVLDGTDNADTRLLLSDACFAEGIPFLYGGATGSAASAASLVPGHTACLRCLIGGEDEAEAGDNCDTAGIVGPAVELAASLQAAEALKWLSGNRAALRRTWITADVWRFSLRETRLPAGRPACPYCGDADKSVAREPDRLDSALEATVLCGRGTIQVATGGALEPGACAARFARRGCRILAANDYLVRALTPCGATLAAFGDGRVLVRGAAIVEDDVGEAIRLCRTYVLEGPDEPEKEELH